MEERNTLTIWIDQEYGEEDKLHCSISFEEKEMNIYDIHRFMKRACVAFGYSYELVEEVFGEDMYD